MDSLNHHAFVQILNVVKYLLTLLLGFSQIYFSLEGHTQLKCLNSSWTPEQYFTQNKNKNRLKKKKK